MDLTTQEIIPFIYSVNAVALPAAAQTSLPLILATDSYFELHYFVANTSVDAATDQSPNNFSANIQINNGRFLMNNPVPQRIMCGPANIYMREQRWIRFNPGDQLNITLLNTTGGAINIFFGLKGFMIFV